MPFVTRLPDSLPLCLTTGTVGAVHTLLGPDHDVPFVAMSPSGNWSLGKTLTMTTACGLAHATASMEIGVIGIAMGLVVM